VWRNWVYEHMETLYEALQCDYVLFGEFLWAKHSVHYDALPDYFLAFDLLRKQDGVFLSYDAMQARLAGRSVSSVPLLWRGAAGPDLLERLAVLSTSRFGHEPAEGVYVRWEDAGRVIGRAKWRRASFVPGRTDFAAAAQNNSLRQAQQQQ